MFLLEFETGGMDVESNCKVASTGCHANSRGGGRFLMRIFPMPFVPNDCRSGWGRGCTVAKKTAEPKAANICNNTTIDKSLACISSSYCVSFTHRPVGIIQTSFSTSAVSKTRTIICKETLRHSIYFAAAMYIIFAKLL